jgi:4-aminobutyrate aminotransferase/(S)-3-amino-2-methylpropionate transaminase
VASAAALAVLEIFEEEDMLGKARALGQKLGARFEAFRKKYPVVGEVRGLGAMLGLALVKGAGREPAAEEAKKLAAFCLERGLIILVCGTYSNVVRVLAPFVITDEQLEKGLSILEAGLAEISK